MSQTISPLEPIRRVNIGRYRDFRKQFHQSLDTYIDQMGELSHHSLKEREQWKAQEAISNIYRVGLELLLVEAMQQEKKLLPLQKVSEATEVIPNFDHWETAVSLHVRRNADAVPKHAGEMLDRIEGETGLIIPERDALRNYVAIKVLNQEGMDSYRSLSSGKKLSYLCQLTGSSKFHMVVEEGIKEKAIEKLLRANFREYEGLREHLGATDHFSPEQVEKVEEKIWEYFGNYNRASFRTMQKMRESAPFTSVTDEDLLGYWEEICSETDWSSSCVNFFLHVRKRELKEFSEETGISLPVNRIKVFACYPDVREAQLGELENNMKKVRFAHSLGDLVPEPEVAEALFRKAHNDGDYSEVSYLMDITEKAPPEEVGREIFKKGIEAIIEDGEPRFPRCFERLVNNHGYSPSEEQIRILAEKAATIREDYHFDDDFSSSIRKVDYLQNLFKANTQELFSFEQQRSLLNYINRRITKEAYSNVKSFVRGIRKLDNYYFPPIFTDEGLKEEASQKAIELLSSHDVYQGMIYTQFTHVDPSFTQEQYDTFLMKKEHFSNRFRTEESAHLNKMAEQWKPGEEA